ncbi:hypothetical protein ARMSODRAFT_972647 [Armillaria solidipes]|uniref:Uncharacterized protein n=1 Tax=Armillaria solidipes TaxID=1076256 RepID=A0A2H3BQI5_9AGAR|nr:hypothetical protein ARMSODRAFT_972647 [Armillaria solidipes]
MVAMNVDKYGGSSTVVHSSPTIIVTATQVPPLRNRLEFTEDGGGLGIKSNRGKKELSNPEVDGKVQTKEEGNWKWPVHLDFKAIASIFWKEAAKWPKVSKSKLFDSAFAPDASRTCTAAVEGFSTQQSSARRWLIQSSGLSGLRSFAYGAQDIQDARDGHNRAILLNWVGGAVSGYNIELSSSSGNHGGWSIGLLEIAMGV